MNQIDPILARVVFQDPISPAVAAVAALALAAVLIWHLVAGVLRGRGRDWTCWSAGVVAAVALAWVTALMIDPRFDGPWIKLSLLALLAGATVIIFYNTVFDYLGPVRMGLLQALRATAIVVLVLLLFRPAVSQGPAQPDRPLLLVLLDRSQSMNEADASGGRTRWLASVDAVLAQQQKLEASFDVRYFVFDQQVQAVERAGQLLDARPAGQATQIDLAMTSLAPLLADARAEAMIVISDGIHNGTGSAVAAADALPRPLLAVGVGGELPEGGQARDLAIARAHVPETVFSNNIAAVDVAVESSGYAGQPARVLLKRPGGELLASADVKLTDKELPVRLEFTPRSIGPMPMQLELVDPQTGEPLAGEAVRENNTHRLVTRVGEPQIRVLYVEGSIRSEYRFLTQTLAADPHVGLMTLIQTRPAGAGGQQAAEFKVKDYGSGRRLGGMPATAEEFSLFDVFIIGDLDRTYLSDRQLDLLADAVSNGGKGLLMIGGSHSFGLGGYGGTTVEKMLPVTLGGRTIGDEKMPFKLTLTAEGKAHPIFAGLVELISPSPDQPASQLPALTGCVKVLSAKTGAEVLAVHPLRQSPDGKGLLPVLTVQRNYGKGRTAAFTADTTWRWGMYRTVAAYGGVYPRFWGQMIRWLASSELVDRKPQSTAILRLDNSYFAPGQPVTLTVHAWDAAGQPADGAIVAVTATPAGPPGQPDEVFSLAAVRDRPGVYQTTFTPTQIGGYRMAMTARKSGQLLGADEAPLTVGQPGAEAAVRSADLVLLQRLAERKPTHLESNFVTLGQYDRLVAQLTAPHEQMRLAPRTEKSWPAYDTSLHAGAMILFVLVLSVEWLLRRRWQLQ